MIAIIAVLAAIVIPVAGGVQTTAKKAKSKNFFTQMLSACSLYESDYGYFPTFGENVSGSDPMISLETAGTDVYKTLVGRSPDGTALNSGERRELNPRARGYFSFSQEQITDTASGEYDTAGLVKDAFGNTDIRIVYDFDGNGVIEGSVIAGASVEPQGGGTTFSMADMAGGIPTQIHDRAVMFSAGAGTRTSVVTTW